MTLLRAMESKLSPQVAAKMRMEVGERGGRIGGFVGVFFFFEALLMFFFFF